MKRAKQPPKKKMRARPLSEIHTISGDEFLLRTKSVMARDLAHNTYVMCGVCGDPFPNRERVYPQGQQLAPIPSILSSWKSLPTTTTPFNADEFADHCLSKHWDIVKWTEDFSELEKFQDQPKDVFKEELEEMRKDIEKEVDADLFRRMLTSHD